MADARRGQPDAGADPCRDLGAATLGYGDVVPATPAVRGLAVFEAVIGQLYLALLLARLVGLQTAAHSR